MPSIHIDYSRCVGDGICAEICPLKLYRMEDNKPQLLKGAGAFCIACGHCVAACPKGAIALEGMTPDDCTPVEPGLRISADAAEHFLMRRRSTRAYKPAPVARHVLEEVLDLSRWAPSASNRQPVKWIMFEKPEEVRKVAELVIHWMKDMMAQDMEAAKKQRLPGLVSLFMAGQDMICRGAPHLLLAHAPAGVPFMAQDCTAAITYVELAALAHDLGTCWAGYVTWAANNSAELRTLLELPEEDQVYGAILLGYPKYRYSRIPERFAPSVRWR
ncbi:nitroreductase family protein [Desulfocurvibacter africanus]|uniref:Nitroreductase n=1 Tax=Desulfocurvibacter africanus subsp. africanus str. Walvis Bay TaxID=690850 RepID=F3Z102_DESAF|nr:nitroreductase family protein [Desulfocurvibacter africanus]EGJ51080.1 nitroreductase [Desulfocurvibacter africanus subsp. africanus str. Walvis Bay]